MSEELTDYLERMARVDRSVLGDIEIAKEWEQLLCGIVRIDKQLSDGDALDVYPNKPHADRVD